MQINAVFCGNNNGGMLPIIYMVPPKGNFYHGSVFENTGPGVPTQVIGHIQIVGVAKVPNSDSMDSIDSNVVPKN